MEISQSLVEEFSGPIIFNYVWWVIREAEKRKIKCLYFLARDGYTLRRVAELFCKQYGLDIQCKYLYCSRMSLRIPSFFFIGDEAYDMLLNWGYSITLESLVCRANLDEGERREVYKECKMEDIEETKILSRNEFDICSKRLRKSKLFRKCLDQKSKEAYANTIGYLKQEGLFNQNIIAIVDSGWTGSMQRSLRHLLEFAGCTNKIIGFYFGMYECPKSCADGEYLTWYFDGKKKARDKAIFNNNLFECILSAPHGMTVGYYASGTSRIEPLLNNSMKMSDLEFVSAQSNNIVQYCLSRLNDNEFSEFSRIELHKDTFKRIRRYMFNPTPEESKYYGRFQFSDDVSELGQSSLADEDQRDRMKNYSIFRRALRKLIKMKSLGGTAELFWPCGTAAFLPEFEKIWYRKNIYLWELIKHKLKQNHNRTPKVCLDYCCSEIDECNIVSFDIFDTLLYRVVNKPTDVFNLMNIPVETKYGISNFYEKRIQAEQIARESSSAEDITLDEIYSKLEINNKEAISIMKYEQDTELFVLRSDQPMIDLVNKCLSKGKTVLAISDMYLSEPFIRKVFKNLKIDDRIRIYVSSQEKATKQSGNLYKLVAKKEKITLDRNWVHIGDNEYSDVIVPKLMGIKSIWYDNGRTINKKISLLTRAKLYIKSWLKVYLHE